MNTRLPWSRLSSLPVGPSLKGLRFGSLVALHVATTTKHGNARMKCQCDCGAVLSVRTGWLKNGRKVDCGDARRHS